jgi:hypothetical protein
MASKSWLRELPFQDGKLLPKCQVFQEEVAARTARLNDQIEKELQRAEHKPVLAEALRFAKQEERGGLIPGCSGGNAGSAEDGNAG